METFSRIILEHRRLLAAAFAGLAVLAALTSQSDNANGTSVTVAAHHLESGHVLTADDVREVAFPDDLVPDTSFAEPDEIIGRRVAGPMAEGEPLTARRVLDPSALDGYGRDAVLASVRVAEPDSVASILAGDVVDIVAVDPHGEHSAEVVARGVQVVTVPAEVSDDRATTVRVVTDEETALALASASISARFSLLLSSTDR